MWHCHLSSYEYGILAGTVPGRNNKKTPYMYWPPKGNWSKGKGKKYIYIPGNFQASELFMDNDSKSVDKHWVLSHTHTHTHTHTTKGQYFLLYYALGDCAVPGQWGKSTVVGGGGGGYIQSQEHIWSFPFLWNRSPEHSGPIMSVQWKWNTNYFHHQQNECFPDNIGE